MTSEVKGAWFVAARAWLDSRGALNRVAGRLTPEVRTIVREPIPAAWYPEEALQEALAALRAEIARDREDFIDAIDGCTEIGTSRFFRALLRIASPGFVLKQVPTMWKQLRRGAGEVSVEVDDGHARIAYSAFPYFADENYRLLTEGSLRAMVRTCTGRDPRVTVVRSTSDALHVDVRWRGDAP